MKTNQELLVSEIVEVDIDVNGKSEQEAIEKSFKFLNQKVYNQLNGYVVKMNVISFVVVSFDKEIFIKKFLGLFLPVEHEIIKMTVKFKVDTSYIKKGEK